MHRAQRLLAPTRRRHVQGRTGSPVGGDEEKLLELGDKLIDKVLIAR